MTGSRNSAGANPRGWRRKWRRTPAERRRTAAAALGDLYERRTVHWLLPALAVLSLLLHGAAIPLMVTWRGASADTIAAREDTYLRKVMQKERARNVAREVKDRMTMPPPPADPEEVVRRAFEETLTSDIEKVVGDLLDVDVTAKLTAHVAITLKDELAEAAKDIADGKLSEDEIRRLHERFRVRAHAAALEALTEHRIETQVERAQMSTTEWYDEQVARTVFNNLRYELFVRRFGRRWPNWYSGKYYGWSSVLYWTVIGSEAYFIGKVNQLKGLLLAATEGYWVNAEKDWARRKRSTKRPEGAPNPGKGMAALIHRRLRDIYHGTVSRGGTYPTPSWRNVTVGGIDTHERNLRRFQTHMTSGLLTEFHPHRQEKVKPIIDRLAKLWKKTLANAKAYKRQAEAGAGPAELKPLHDACFASIKAIADEAKLIVDMRDTTDHGYRSYSGDKHVVNRITRARVLMETRSEMHKYLVDELTDGLTPLIKRFARGQFRKGIIVKKEGVKDAMKAFLEEIIPLLRRDVERLFPRKRWDHMAFAVHGRYYKNVLGEATSVPSAKDYRNELATLEKILKRKPGLRPYAEKRYELNRANFRNAVRGMAERTLDLIMTGGLLLKRMEMFVEGVDYADGVREKLDARARALEGRGQDLAKLTRDGVPDTSAPLVALLFGASRGSGANLQPVLTALSPAFVSYGMPKAAIRGSMPRYPPPPAKWGFEEQAQARPTFKVAPTRVEGIPFLPKFPNLDGDLSDWGYVRPLILRGSRGKEPSALYAAWNYQGFFFGYHVKQDAERFYYPSQMRGGISFRRVTGTNWAYVGDYLQLFFDTLDARNANRGEPHSQEFVIFPRGTDTDPNMPGIERIFKSQRDAKPKEYRGVKASGKVFPGQPDGAPDGSGPHRVTRMTKDGYTVEIFIPRSIFNVPIFAPGWYVGFDAVIAGGYQGRSRGRRRLAGWTWAGGNGLRPDRWGDLLLLGTDARLVVQNATPSGEITRGIIPGHSYLLTVIDPDRNVNMAMKDAVLVSAEVKGGQNDVEVFILKETGKNTGMFRGYVNTQPGPGRQYHGVLEAMPGDELRFGYVDFANAKGERMVITEARLPVISGLTKTVAAK